MGKDRPILDASLSDRRRAFKFFVVNFRDFCVMRDYINPAFDHQDYWIWLRFVALSHKRNGTFSLLLSTRKSPRRTHKILHNGSSSSLSWRGADNVKYTPFPRHPETRARNVYPSMAYSSACGIQKMQLSFSSWWQIAERHFCYWPKWFFPMLSQWHHPSWRLNFSHFCSSHF